MNKLFTRSALPLFLVFILVACGGNQKKQSHAEEEKAEKMDQSHDEMDHSAMDEEEEVTLLPVPAEARVYFANLKEGDSISMPFTVKFAVEGMEVEPAGKLNEGKGHHHLIIGSGSLERGLVVPADSLNIHYGKGQIEAELDLPPGEHMLTMQFADGYHQSYGEQLSSSVNVIVK